MAKIRHWSGGICLRRTSRGIAVLLVCEPSEVYFKEGYMWSLPGGKCCSDMSKMVDCCGETPEQTLIREFKEETGYDIVPGAIFWTKDNTDHKKHYFGVRAVSGESLKKKVFSRESPAWFLLDRLPRNMIQSHKKQIQRYVLARVLAA